MTFKTRVPVSFTSEFCQTFEEKSMPILCNLFQKTEAKGILPNSSYQASITPIPKPDRGITRKEHYRPISLMNIDVKFLNKILANQSQQCIKRILYTMAKRDLGSTNKKQLM